MKTKEETESKTEDHLKEGRKPLTWDTVSSTFTLARSCWRLTRELKEIEASWKRNSDDQRRNDQERRNRDQGKEEAEDKIQTGRLTSGVDV